MGFLSNPQIIIILQLILATILGAVIGLEREYKKKEAGLRTYSLVSLGAALFTITGLSSFAVFSEKSGITLDPSRVVAAIVMGVGFIGAGLIIYREARIEGLTTAAGLWVAAAVGVAVGVKLFYPAFFVTFLALAILAGLRLIEERIFNKS